MMRDWRVWRALRKREVLMATIGMFALVLMLLSSSLGDVVVAYTATGSVGGHTTPVPLSKTPHRVRVRCGRTRVAVTPKVTVYPSSTRALISITLPRICRGTRFTFNDPVRFTASTAMKGEFGLESNMWSSNMGWVRVCMARAGHGCLTSNMRLTSTTSPPLTTSFNGLASGQAYGPRIRTSLGNPGGTATVMVLMDVAKMNGANVAWAQQDAMVLQFTQL